MDNQLSNSQIKIISPTVHGVLDYVVVVLLLISPTLFELSGAFAFAAYALGLVHLLLTVTTSFSSGLFSVLSFRFHGLLELLIALGLIISPWLFAFTDLAVERNFFLLFGVAVFITWLLTGYVSKGKRDSIDGGGPGLEAKTKETPDTNSQSSSTNEV